MIELISGKFYSDLTSDELLQNLIQRLNLYFYISEREKEILKSNSDNVIQRMFRCVSKVENKYFIKDGKPFFSYLHSGQYLMYLYFFSNEVRNIEKGLMNKLYYLNKILHAVDIYGEIELPEVFFFEHPLGLVLGRARYGNNFFAMQGCTVGGNKRKYLL